VNIVIVAINAKFIHTSLAAHSLLAYLDNEEKKHIQLREFTVNQSENLIVSELFAMRPNVLAFSCYIWNISLVRSLVETITKIMPNVVLVFGGPEADFTEHIVVQGEGELAFKSLVRDILSNLPLQQVYKSVEAVSLRDIPFPYENFDGRILYYETSRGCFNRCGYCLSSASTEVRFLPVERVYEDLDIFLDQKVKQVKFVDRTFNCDKQHAIAIWKYLIRHDNGFTNFHFEIAGDLLDDEIISLLKKARPGLFQFEIGVQSTNPATLATIQRSTDSKKIFENVSKLKLIKNIHLHLDLIVGLPYEDYPTFARSFNDVMACRPHKLQVGFLKLLKGSKLRQNADKYGIKFKSNAPYEVLETSYMNFEAIDKLKQVEEIVDLFYNSDGFKYTVNYMIDQFDTPFDFFEALAKYWWEKKYHMLSHKKMSLYTILYEFGKQDDLLSELLRFDMLLRENIRTFPEWMNYQYDNKEITRDSAVHRFTYDVCNVNGQISEKDICVHFDYKKQTNPSFQWQAGFEVLPG